MLCFHCTDIYIKFFDNFHFQPNTILIIGILKFTFSRHFFSFGKKRLVFKQYIEHLFEQAKRLPQRCNYQRIKIDKNVLLFKTLRFLLKKNHQKNINFKLVRITNIASILMSYTASEC